MNRLIVKNRIRFLSFFILGLLSSNYAHTTTTVITYVPKCDTSSFKAFLTTKVYDGNLTALGGADKICSDEAQVKKISLKSGFAWRAIISSEKYLHTLDARYEKNSIGALTDGLTTYCEEKTLLLYVIDGYGHAGDKFDLAKANFWQGDEGKPTDWLNCNKWTSNAASLKGNASSGTLACNVKAKLLCVEGEKPYTPKPTTPVVTTPPTTPVTPTPKPTTPVVTTPPTTNTTAIGTLDINTPIRLLGVLPRPNTTTFNSDWIGPYKAGNIKSINCNNTCLISKNGSEGINETTNLIPDDLINFKIKVSDQLRSLTTANVTLNSQVISYFIIARTSQSTSKDMSDTQDKKVFLSATQIQGYIGQNYTQPGKYTNMNIADAICQSDWDKSLANKQPNKTFKALIIRNDRAGFVDRELGEMMNANGAKNGSFYYDIFTDELIIGYDTQRNSIFVNSFNRLSDGTRTIGTASPSDYIWIGSRSNTCNNGWYSNQPTSNGLTGVLTHNSARIVNGAVAWFEKMTPTSANGYLGGGTKPCDFRAHLICIEQ